MVFSVDEALKKAVAAHKEGKLQEAERTYRAILNAKPFHPDANHNLGVICAACGEHETAVAFFKTAIASKPIQEESWLACADALTKLGRIVDARSLVRQAINTGLNSDRILSSFKKLEPSSKKLEFFYKYLTQLGVFSSEEDALLDGNSKPIPLLTSSFLDWFTTQNWTSQSLLELGSGGSTLYFSHYFQRITSYETDEKWHEKLTSQVPKNVKLFKSETILDSLQRNNTENINSFDVILLDAGENRAKIARWLVERNYNGVIFFDNAEWYRKSVTLFLEAGFLEIPFFGLKPVEDWLSCTSVLAHSSNLSKILNGNWVSLPQLAQEMTSNIWDDEFDNN